MVSVQLFGFSEEFGDLLSRIVTHCDNIIMSGDFNIYLDNSNNWERESFLSPLDSFELKKHDAGSTHIKENI